ncbi:MAG TPA: hypothetical protein VLA42_15460 [Verrucomicrobiae bacterium]|nr:hypothetical protein [Verrucomicrobiae bacterium]
MTAFSRPKFRGVAPARHAGSVIVFCPRAGIRECKAQCSTKDRAKEEETKGNMAIIKAPRKQTKSVAIQARVEESVKTQLDQCAKFIDSTPSYVIAEALKVLFKRDDEFKVWSGQQSSSGKIHELTGGGLKETA